MLTEREKQECEILAIFESQLQPIGSGTLSMMLKKIEFGLSEATVGRLLSEMDHKGWTKKLGYQGRILTEKGHEHLGELRAMKKRIMYSSMFLNSLNIKDKNNLIEVLEARRAIEKELCRLAALNATDTAIEQMQHICQEQKKQIASGIINSEQDLNFHRSIANLAKNRVLASALELIQQDGQLSSVLEYIRFKVGGSLVIDHEKILEAIRQRSPVEAEKRMVEHIEGIIGDVEKYWELVKKND